MNNTEMLAPRLIGSSAWLEHKDQRILKVLVACEYSGIVRDAFAARGHDAWSCDLLPSERPGKHFEDDVLQLIGWSSAYQHWDLIIAHPPCTYLSSSGMHWTTRGLRDPKLTVDAIKFAERLWDAQAEHICIENPVGCLSTRSKLGKPTQTIQPYEFGEDASKRTCLWLKNLPPLQHSAEDDLFYKKTHVGRGEMKKYADGTTRTAWFNQTAGNEPSTYRSRTFPGIASAMANQWTLATRPNNRI